MGYKYNFFNDYSEGAHPDVLKALETFNSGQENGYGDDSVTLKTKELIRQNIGNPIAEIFFVSGGTQANLVVIAALLKPYESVIAASTSHINVHEAGAIEATGHKIEIIQSSNGKIAPSEIAKIIDNAMLVHMTKPKTVFISNSTEVGTIYSKTEIMEISKVCKEKSLYLYLDGARLGSALSSEKADLTLYDIANLTDVFYIGGTKNGAALGEAIVINNPSISEDFEYFLKQHGALLAKGRFIAAQFIALFENGLYFDLAKHANQMAANLTQGIKDQGFKFLTESPTNQIFPIFNNNLIEKLEKLYGFYVWEKVDENNSAIRLVTSWSTPENAVLDFLQDLKTL